MLRIHYGIVKQRWRYRQFGASKSANIYFSASYVPDVVQVSENIKMIPNTYWVLPMSTAVVNTVLSTLHVLSLLTLIIILQSVGPNIILTSWMAMTGFLCYPGAHLLVDEMDKQRVLRAGKRGTQFSCGIGENLLDEVTPELSPGGWKGIMSRICGNPE